VLIEVRDDRRILPCRLVLEKADVVAHTADVFPTYNDVGLLLSHVAMKPHQVLRSFMYLDLLVGDFCVLSQRLNQTFPIVELCIEWEVRGHC